MDRNPLQQYFRQPAIFIRLPSQGKFYPEGALAMPANGEIGVLPMTTMDEITYRTPDALFNGSAVADVIESCVPAIRDGWAVPSMDVDTLLVSIRIATYGHDMDITTQCPACEATGDYTIDLRRVMDQIESPDYDHVIQLGDLEIHFRPMSYQQLNQNSLAQFEEQKTLQMMQGDDVSDDQRIRNLSSMLKKITAATARALSENISYIKTPQTVVDDQGQILEWLTNSDRATFNQVRDHIIKLKQSGELKPVHIKCDECGHEHDQSYTLDLGNFFVRGS
jgi:hypothetical protein